MLIKLGIAKQNMYKIRGQVEQHDSVAMPLMDQQRSRPYLVSPISEDR